MFIVFYKNDLTTIQLDISCILNAATRQNYETRIKQMVNT